MRKGGARERADGLFLQKNKPEQSGLCSDVVGYYEKDAAALRPRKRLVVSQSRRERACKRTGDANATFCEKEEQRNEHALTFENSRSKRYAACSDVAEKGRLELPRRFPDLRP